VCSHLPRGYLRSLKRLAQYDVIISLFFGEEATRDEKKVAVNPNIKARSTWCTLSELMLMIDVPILLRRHAMPMLYALPLPPLKLG
jgi:hypothetical protein